MKKIAALFFSMMIAVAFAFAQADYKVVFDLTSKDSVDQQAVIRWLKEITNERPDAKLEVVMYAKGVNMATKEKSAVANEVTQLATNIFPSRFAPSR